jgi:hypothetical protein
MAWLPLSWGPVRQYPSRKNPVIGSLEKRARGLEKTEVVVSSGVCCWEM